MAYTQRYAGGFANGDNAKQVDATFLNNVETALLALFGVTPATNGALIWDGTKFTAAALIKNAQIDAAAAIDKSKLAALNIADADVSGSAAIAASKLAAIPPSKLTGYPSDVTKVLRGDGTWVTPDRGQYGMSAPQSVPTGVLTVLNTNWVNNVSIGGVSMSAGTITVANAGVYLVTTAVQFVANATGVFEVQWAATGVASGGMGGLIAVPNSAALATPAINMSQIVFFNAGGTVNIQAAQTSGANMNIFAQSFNICRLV